MYDGGVHTLPLALLVSSALNIHFIEDDYPRAVEAAKTEQKLLFVDAWAPWCHTCVVMRETVFPQPQFADFEKDVVFAAIDTEQSRNAAFLEQFPVQVLPTLLLIEPQSGRVLLQWLGSADATQFQSLITAAKSAATRQDAGEAQSQNVNGRTILSLLSTLSRAKEYESCARTGLSQLELLRTNQERVAALTWSIDCALQWEKRDDAVVAQLVQHAIPALEWTDVLSDDTSSLYEVLVQHAQGTPQAPALATKWFAFTSEQAEHADTPAARAAFDAHRLAAAIASKQATRMKEPLMRSEEDFPLDYNPPARLALMYQALGNFREARQAIERALKKCKEGPRKLRLFDIKLSIVKAQGHSSDIKRTLQDAITYARSLPSSQQRPARLADYETQLAALKPQRKNQ